MNGVINLVWREIGPFALLLDGIIVEEEEYSGNLQRQQPKGGKAEFPAF
jgi:hypothetical protein